MTGLGRGASLTLSLDGALGCSGAFGTGTGGFGGVGAGEDGAVLFTSAGLTSVRSTDLFLGALAS